MTGDREDITRWREDMNFVVLATSNIKFISSSQRVMFFLLYKRINDDVWMIFRRFPTTFRRFLKIAEYFRGRPENVSMIHQRL